MSALVRNIIRSGVFIATISIGMSNSIVLPSTGPSPSTHLDELIRDVFVVPVNGNNSGAQNVNISTNRPNTNSKPCWGRCAPAHISCSLSSADPTTDFSATYDDNDDAAGEGFLDIRIAKDMSPTSAHRFCNDATEKCCNHFAQNKHLAPLATNPVVMDEGALHIGQACGISVPDVTMDRVTTDGASEIDEFPWMAAILWRTPSGAIAYKCGSTLIHPSVVLTVAHCVYQTPASRLLIRVGNRDIVSERGDQRDRRIRQVIVHEHFNASRYSLHNDVALLFLDTPVQMSVLGVRAVCLPAQPRRPGNAFDRHRCMVSGWGTPVRRPGSGRQDALRNVRQLKKIQVPVVPRPMCERSLRGTRLGRRFRLHRSFICAGGEPGRDACTGDGGSPLMCPIEEERSSSPTASGQVRYVQAGIVALGIGCGNNVPGVYVNVAEFRNWIDEQMIRNGYARSYYQM